MSDLTAKFTALEEQLAAQNATIAGYIDTVEAKLQLIADELDTININGAVNTKALLAALGQTGACFPCPSPPMTVPPIGTTPGAVDNDRCKRAQAIIAVIHSILENMDTMQSFNVIGTYNVISGAISDIIGAIVAGDTVPLPSAPETINIVGNYISYAGERVFSGVGLLEQFEPLEVDLQNAIYLTNTPGDAQAAYNAVIDASGASLVAKYLFEGVAYSALWSYYFDPASEPDLSGYNGAVCQGYLADITQCTAFASVTSVYTGTTWERILLPPPSAGDGLGIQGDFFGWKIKYTQTYDTVHNVGIGGYNASNVFVLLDSGHQGDADFVISTHLQNLYIYTLDTNENAHPFIVTICPPA